LDFPALKITTKCPLVLLTGTRLKKKKGKALESENQDLLSKLHYEQKEAVLGLYCA
jgi:hypothetical protein